MINFLVGLSASILSVLLTLLSQFGYKKYKQRGLAAILNFLGDQITFIYPPREDCDADPYKVILPRTATEDFLSINNVLSAFLKIQWNGNIQLCNSKEFGKEERKRDLIFICSPLSNDGTKEVLAELSKKYRCGIPQFKYDEEKKQCYLRVSGGRYDSSTYDVVKECIKAGTRPEEAEMYDHAVLLKAENPWDPTKKVIVLAGIRGIGTWGAGECLKKGWQEIYNRKHSKGGQKKSGDFVAVIRVNFNKCDLVGFKIENFIDLDR
jgi:hypothetical protein